VKRDDKWAMPSHFAKTHVATLVLGFFEFYTKFNFNLDVISVRLGKEPFKKRNVLSFADLVWSLRAPMIKLTYVIINI
jgi:hypothetical protein